MVVNREFTFTIVVILLLYADAEDCPDKLPIKFKNMCYSFEPYPIDRNFATMYCNNLHADADVASIPDTDFVHQKLLPRVNKFIERNKDKTYVWVGYQEKDNNMGGEAVWEFDSDETTMKPEDYTYFTKTPSGNEKCSMIDGTIGFDKVVPVRCDSPQINAICTKTDDPCFDNQKQFHTYKDMCIRFIPGTMKHDDIGRECGFAAKPAHYKNDHEKEIIMLAIRNGMVGATVSTGLKKDGDKWVFPDGSQIKDEDWEENQPDDRNDCAGVALQFDGSLKFRTARCDNIATLVCSYALPAEETTTSAITTMTSTTTTTEGIE